MEVSVVSLGEIWGNLHEAVREALEEGPLGWAVLDLGLRFVKVNRAFCDMLGYPADELLGRSVWEITYPDDVAVGRDLASRKFAGELTSYGLEKRYVTRDGRVIWGSLSSYVIRDPDGRPAGSLGIVEDISRRKADEERIRALLDERERRMGELDRSNRELRQFAYVASHDLREPLRTMASFAELLQRRYAGRLDANADEFLAFITDAAQRLSDLINDLLAYATVGAEPQPFVDVSCEEIFDEAVADLSASIGDAGARVTRDALPRVPGCPRRLGQLFRNLLENALKFRGDAPPLAHLSAAREGDHWAFALTDNGIGFDDRDAARIFEIFRRLHARDAYEGTGVGLAVCKKIVEQHGGRIWAQSRPGEGATFSFTLPAG